MGIIKRMADVEDAKSQQPQRQKPVRCDGCHTVSFEEGAIVPMKKDGIDLMACVDFIQCLKTAADKKIYLNV